MTTGKTENDILKFKITSARLQNAYPWLQLTCWIYSEEDNSSS